MKLMEYLGLSGSSCSDPRLIAQQYAASNTQAMQNQTYAGVYTPTDSNSVSNQSGFASLYQQVQEGYDQRVIVDKNFLRDVRNLLKIAYDHADAACDAKLLDAVIKVHKRCP
jgi:hypothetical protein